MNGLGAKPIKKPNGNDVSAGNLKAGSIYTLRYNGTNFILQGEGGSGTAQPADVLSGKTFTNDIGEQIGTMTNNGVKTITPSNVNLALNGFYASGSKVAAVTFDASKVLTGTTIAGTAGTMPNRGAVVITPSTANQAIAAGYHNGSGYVVGDPDLIPANIVFGKNIFGVSGSYDKIFNSTEAGLLWALGLPVLPTGVTPITGRYRIITGTGSYMYAPAGKTWIVMNPATGTYRVQEGSSYYITTAGIIFQVFVVTENRTDARTAGILLPANIEVLVYEIDCPSIVLGSYGTTSVYDLGTNKALGLLAVGTNSTSGSSLMLGRNYGYNLVYKKNYTNIYVNPEKLIPCLPLTGQTRGDRLFVIALIVPSDWNITANIYSIGAKATITLGTVPTGKTWVCAFTISDGMRILLNDINMNISIPCSGVFISSGVTIKIYNNNTNSTSFGFTKLELPEIS